MIEDADEWYRVQISGSGFSVTSEAALAEDDAELSTKLAAYTISDAIAMASHKLPRVMEILAEIVVILHHGEACKIQTVRPAEDAFYDAARRLVLAWDKYDANK